jgi:hypothetical protein
MMFAASYMAENKLGDNSGPDNPIEFLAYATAKILHKTGGSPVGAFVGAYSWCDIWRAVSPALGFKGCRAPEWIVINDAVMVRDRSVNRNVTEFSCDGKEFHARLLALPNGRRIFEEIERHCSNERVAVSSFPETNRSTA